MTVNETISEYREVSRQILELEKYRHALQSKLIDYMQEKNLKSYEGDKFKLRLQTTTREIISKKSVPAELWAKYATNIAYPRLYVSKKVGGNDRGSP